MPRSPGLGSGRIRGLAIRDILGEWGLRLLLVTLAMTPLRWITGKPWPLQFRRLLGLWSFAYLALHFVTYFFLDRSLDLPVIIEDIAKRPFITIGFAAFVLMIPLAVTSTAGWRRQLGTRWLTPAQAGLRGGDPRLLAFLLAGEEGRAGAARLLRDPGRAAGVPGVEVAATGFGLAEPPPQPAPDGGSSRGRRLETPPATVSTR